jgi:hypothetical protein
MSEISSDGPFVSSVGLVITGTNLNPLSVTAALGIGPDECWLRGDAKRVGNSRHEWGGWKKHLSPRDEGDPFADDLQTWANLLSSKGRELRDLQEAGAQCFLSCFITVSDAALVILEPQLQRDLASLGVEIRLAIWGSQNAG